MQLTPGLLCSFAFARGASYTARASGKQHSDGRVFHASYRFLRRIKPTTWLSLNRAMIRERPIRR